jgi:CheY-like chemotaxis protein
MNGPHTAERLGLRILVAEDHPDTAASLALILRLSGHEVTVVPDGVTALQTALASRPDVLLLDIGMPGLDGWQVATRLTEQLERDRPLLVAMTGYGQDEDHRRSDAAGIHLHLVKPVDPQWLQALLRQFRLSNVP